MNHALEHIKKYVSAANYLSVAQIYLINSCYAHGLAV